MSFDMSWLTKPLTNVWDTVSEVGTAVGDFAGLDGSFGMDNGTATGNLFDAFGEAGSYAGDLAGLDGKFGAQADYGDPTKDFSAGNLWGATGDATGMWGEEDGVFYNGNKNQNQNKTTVDSFGKNKNMSLVSGMAKKTQDQNNSGGSWFSGVNDFMGSKAGANTASLIGAVAPIATGLYTSNQQKKIADKNYNLAEKYRNDALEKDKRGRTRLASAQAGFAGGFA